MKKTSTMPSLILSLLLLFAFAASCSENNKSLSEKEFKLTEKTALNKKLVELNNSLKDAETDFKKAEIYTNIALINSEKGNAAASIKSAAEAIRFQPNQYMSHYLLGKSYIGVGRYNDAIDELEKAVEMRKNFAPAWFELGNAHYKKFDFKSARTAYQTATRHDPKLLDAYNNLGAIQITLGALADAEKNFNTCLAIDPSYAPAYKNLGILYDTRLGKPAKAVENYSAYLKLRPDCPERVLVKMWISALKG
jgi:tetratricopeptide (TPR) repeat protein